MTPHVREEFSTRLINWNLFVIVGNAMLPRDHSDEDEDNGADEPRVVREPGDD
jgi:hypothetical protein